ncbi:MAG: MaoC family dehydratase N-terminal domain-containing protein [Nitrososphaerota archaeon]|nr:MaoC family dehydratase N-terminal domain-containing protein [Nitrososphaerota archaeon]
MESYPDLGVKLVTEKRTVTETDIVNYAGLSGDFHPAHTDATYAAKTRFNRIMAHGLLTLSLSQGLLTRTEFRKIIQALLGVNNVKFVNPVFPGDTIGTIFEVTGLRQSKSKPDMWILTLHAVVQKNGEVVMEYDTSYAVFPPPARKSTYQIE